MARTHADKDFNDGINEVMALVQGNEAEAATVTLLAALEKGSMAGVVDEGTVNNVGYALLKQQQTEVAIAAFAFNVKTHPDSPNVYDSLGDAYESAGMLDLAKTNYALAYEKATATGDNRNAETFKKNMDRVQQQLSAKKR